MGYDVFGLGNSLVDALVVVEDESLLERHGLRRGTMHLVDDPSWQAAYADVPHEQVAVSAGGSCSNSIFNVSLLGGSATYCGLVGRDRWGDAYDRRLSDVLGPHYLRRRDELPTGKCLSIVSAVDAERTMLTDLGCAMELRPDELPEGQIETSSWLHLTGYLFTGGSMGDAARAALSAAKVAGCRISFDVADAFVIQNFRPAVDEVITEYADLVFMNEEEARLLGDGDAMLAAERVGRSTEVVVVKLGSRGSIVTRGPERYSVDAIAVEAIDSTGAGDAYAGGFLFGLTRGLDLETCAALASSVAGHTVAQLGSVVRDQELLDGLVAEFC